MGIVLSQITPYDLTNHEFLWGQEKVMEMTGVDSVLPIDGRLGLASIRVEVQRKIGRMKNIGGFDPCAFSILSGPSILYAHESQLYDL